MTPWWKKPWVWLVGFAFSVILFLFILGCQGRVTIRKPEGLDIPPRPPTPDVPVPDRVELNTTPADEYEEEKTKPEDVKDTMASVNSRFK